MSKEESFDTDVLLEFFQLNLIFVLWYMKNNNIKNKYIDYLIKKFIKDLEGVVIELGFSESSLKKHVRTIIQNFYGRLYTYSNSFDELIDKKNESAIKKLIHNNFNFKVNRNLLINYFQKNIRYFKKLNINLFWNDELFFIN